MKIHFLGTNGYYDTDTGNTICTLIETNDCYIILDAGNGIYKVNQYLKNNKPVYLFISHLHIDHIAGLHILPDLNIGNSLKIYVPQGMKKYVYTFVNSPFTLPITKEKYAIEVIELEEKSYQSPIKFACQKIFHAGICYGYCFNLENKIITYCVDTGIYAKEIDFVKDSDLLIHECTFKKNQSKSSWGHASPVEAADLAKKANVRSLILTHFGANQYLSLQERDDAAKKAQAIFNNTISAKDGLTITI